MRNPFYVILLGILIFVSADSVSVQDTKNDPGSSYNSAIGIRGGFFTGITYKQFIGDKAALEGILSTRWRGFSLTGLYERHEQAFDVEGLRWYYGGGGHIGIWDDVRTPWATTAGINLLWV